MMKTMQCQVKSRFPYQVPGKCNRGDQVAPPLPKMPLLPPAVQQLPDLSPNEDLLLDDVSIEELLALAV